MSPLAWSTTAVGRTAGDEAAAHGIVEPRYWLSPVWLSLYIGRPKKVDCIKAFRSYGLSRAFPAVVLLFGFRERFAQTLRGPPRSAAKSAISLAE